MAIRAYIRRFVGYEGDHGHIWRIWDPKTNKINRTRDVDFVKIDYKYKGDWDKDEVIPINPPIFGPLTSGPAINTQSNDNQV